MRMFPPEAKNGGQVGERQVGASAFSASSDHEPPAPLEMFARLGVLLLVALGFGLAAQLLVAASY